MKVGIASVNGTFIRLPDERWEHISEEHSELADMPSDVLDTVAQPERILAGGAGELLAVRAVEEGKWMVVVYREFDDDGFVVTAFLTRRRRSLDKRNQLWPLQTTKNT